MNILLVSPRTPATFWSFRHALKFISKKSSEPPLGLLTIAAMLPQAWELKLVDMNVAPLRDDDLTGADMVFLSGMNIHLRSMQEVIARANRLNVPVAVGGPLVTTDRQLLPGADHYFLGEGEETLPQFLQDLQHGKVKKVYRAQRFPDIQKTPVPRWDLLDVKSYASLSLQFSRGCPFNCDFCNVTILNGHKPRIKSAPQFLAELQAIYDMGWRGSVFIVDDNFIGNRKILKQEILPALIDWMETHKRPFSFITEVSVNLADDDRLMNLMVQAGFDSVFVGIETPNAQSLSESNKKQNTGKDLLLAVKKMQRHGLIVSGGFIVGFDHDPPEIFDIQKNFIQHSGIITAMVGLLSAPTGTRLFKRMKEQGRLIKTMSGDNMDGSTNIIPKMDLKFLKAQYQKLLNQLYDPEGFYERLKVFLRDYQLPERKGGKLSLTEIKAFVKSLFVLGLFEKGRMRYWKILFYSLIKFPKKFPLAVRLSIFGYHFRRVARSLS
ncbi:B12-binding domain-containing radical SAM protein [Calditrichota bacterium LG25]